MPLRKEIRVSNSRMVLKMKNGFAKATSLIYAVICVSGLIGLFVLLWFKVLRHRFGPEGLARDLVLDQYHHDWQPLYDNAFPNEKKYITRDQAGKIFNWIVWPEFDKLQKSGPMRTAMFPNGFEAVAEIDISNGKDAPFYT